MSRIGERVLASALAEDGNHLYVSTYCVHGRCDACRLACKTCQVPCLHDCHTEGEAGDGGVADRH